MNSLLLTIIANLSVDFLWQSRKIAVAKDNLKPAAIFLHGLALFGTMLFFLHGYQWLAVMVYAAAITAAHLLVDICKALFSRVKHKGLNLLVLIIDQVVKLITIILIWSWFDLRANPGVISFYERLFRIEALASFTGATSMVKLVPERFLLEVIIYLYVCPGGSVLIDRFLFWLRKKEDIFGMTADRTGKWIGILERAIVLSLIINDTLDSVAFILTAKSIARFSELSNRDFAEYYLIGTLSSTMLAICGGLALNYLLALV